MNSITFVYCWVLVHFKFLSKLCEKKSEFEFNWLMSRSSKTHLETSKFSAVTVESILVKPRLPNRHFMSKGPQSNIERY